MVLNKTVPLHGSHGQHTGVHRVALEEHVPNQRIIFRVNGNASASNIKCFRYDQSGWQNISWTYSNLKNVNFLSPLSVIVCLQKCSTFTWHSSYSVSKKAMLYIITALAYQWLSFNIWFLCLAVIRSNGLFAHTVGMALVFAQQVSESDAGLYTCSASWYHHNATVTVLVEVTSQKMNSSEYLLLCPMMAIVAYRPLQCLKQFALLYKPDTVYYTRSSNCLKHLMSHFGSF